ncbi:MAG: DNA polymerase III subunit gamma/tau, partial [Pseudomonadota bacterium]
PAPVDAPAGPRPQPSGGGGPAAAADPAPRPSLAPDVRAEALTAYQSFEQVVALIAEKRDAKLRTDVEDFVRLVRYAPGRIEFEPAPGAPRDLAQALAARLSAWTGARWMVSVTQEPGAPSVTEARRAEDDAARAEATAHPLVAAALAAFPGARIAALRPLTPAEAETPPPPEDDEVEEDYGDDWSPVDPFAE